MSTAAADRVLRGLDDQQALAVLAPAGPVRIMAGAGTGKTRTITHRIAYQHLTGAMPANQLLAVTHSNKAAGEMRDRLAHLGVGQVQARTFHAAALRQLQYFWSATGLPGARPNVIDAREGYRYMRFALSAALRMPAKDVPSEHVTDLATELAWSAARDLTGDRYVKAAVRDARSPGMPLQIVADAIVAYTEAKRENAVLDFADLLTFCALTLEQNPHVAQTVRAQYTAFVVDEYQDTDPSQQRLLNAWLGDRDTVAVVGDPRQAIYRFKGAEPSLIRDFTTRFPHAVSVDVVQDYRSTIQVVQAANRLMAGTPEATGPELIGMLGEGPTPHVVRCSDEDAEDDAIVDQVRDWLRGGVPAEEIAILHRFNAQAVKLTAALRDAGIPVVGGDGTAYFSRREIAEALRTLRGVAAQTPDAPTAEVFPRVLAHAGYSPDSPPDGTGAARERWDALAALAALVESLPAELTRTAGALSRDLDRRAAEDHVPPGRGAVRVSTIHKAKGLEWTAVVIARSVEGSLPSAYATTPDELDEERRMAYVAVTRAKKFLVATWAAQRTGGRPNTVSPYLRSLKPPAPARAPRSGTIKRSARSVATPAVSATGRKFTLGQRVNHDKWGLGTVVGVGSELKVDFGTDAPRTIKPTDGRLIAL